MELVRSTPGPSMELPAVLAVDTVNPRWAVDFATAVSVAWQRREPGTLPR